ncbi:Dolichol-phosphate mannosyltransferase subunit 3 [Trinorchestia longiramus]|nr:Dolichol-phosphate mannosyltransferase subunit 3 [Trinorchestia longiramus]
MPYKNKTLLRNNHLCYPSNYARMTKLVEWLMTAALIFVPWLAIITNKFENGFTRDYYLHILVLPLLLVACFGLVSVAIIGYRVYSFNDCKEAAQELQLQIEEAKKDLVSKGFKFERNS